MDIWAPACKSETGVKRDEQPNSIQRGNDGRGQKDMKENVPFERMLSSSRADPRNKMGNGIWELPVDRTLAGSNFERQKHAGGSDGDGRVEALSMHTGLLGGS
ncbi:hypothetical protein K438DRAFT_1782713 [Mycena galopus ATCC 62051]|nr:hypothetical protein K438DRAFT_1782713 [Mycena galopus ATCC 62051]